MSDVRKIYNDLNTVISTLSPNVDLVTLSIRLEEVLSNYNIQRKTTLELESDIPENINTYLSSKKLEGLSLKTIKGYGIELNLFSKFCKKAISQVTTSDIRKYLSSFKDAQMSTIGTKLSVLKSFFGWLVKEEVILRDPSAKVKLPKTPKRLPKGLTIEELETVRESCKTLRKRALLEVFYSTGCRLSEIVNLNKDNINIQNMNARVIGKGNKERTVYLSFKALHHLKRYLKSRNDDNSALFVSEKKPYNRLGSRGIQHEMNEIEIDSGISKSLTPHVMRHTFASLSMDAGIELTDLQHLMGHTDPSTTLIYSRVSEERKQQAFKKFHVQ